jgi:hypothetical protein
LQLIKIKILFKIRGCSSILFGVSKTAFLNWLKGTQPRPETRANGYKLTVFEEEVLSKHLLDADKQGFSI